MELSCPGVCNVLPNSSTQKRAAKPCQLVRPGECPRGLVVLRLRDRGV